MVSVVKDKPPIVTPVSTERSASPALCFTLELRLDEYPYEMPLKVEGFLLSEDGKILTSLLESRLLPEIELEASQISSLSRPLSKIIYSIKARDIARSILEPRTEKISLVAWLDKKMLDEINTLRQKRGGDVFFKVLLNILMLRFSIVVHHTDLISPEEYGLRKVRGKGIMVSAYFPSGFATGKEDLWLLSGYGSPQFLTLYEYADSIEVKIPESEWVREFMPKLGLGTYFIVEVPAKGVLQEAWSLVEKAEEAFHRWDTKGVFANCREVGYLLDRLVESSNLSEFVKREKWGRVYECFKHFASLGLHLEDIKKSQHYNPEDIKVTPEDCANLLILTKSLIKYVEDLGVTERKG
jgi:hypothetical protein